MAILFPNVEFTLVDSIGKKITVVKGGTATKLNSNATSVLTNDTDTENNTLTAILVNNVTNGTLTFNSNGTFTYVHNGSDTTTDSFSYKANDGTSNSNTVVVTISIVPFAVDFNNFLIQTKSETCAGKNNGEISIKATQSFNYTATINTKNYNFVNNSLTVPFWIKATRHSIGVTLISSSSDIIRLKTL